jgi:predicted nucleotidyltransferase
MNFGLTTEELQLLKTIVLIPLKKRGAKVYIFGSRACGKHHPFSDIDLLFEQNPNNLFSISEISEIRENLENSELPFKVDLVDSFDLAKSYIAKIDKEKILLVI